MTFLSRRCLLLVLSVVSSSFSAGPLTEYIHAPGKFIAPIPENSLKIERNISLEMCAAKCTLYFRMHQFPCYAFEYTAGSRICAFTNMTTLMVKNGYLGLHVSDGVDYYERSKASFKNLFREIPNSAIRQQNSYYVIKLNTTQEECAYDCLLSHAQTCLSFSYSDRSGTCGLSNVFWTEGNSNGISLLSTKVYNHYQYFTAWPCNVTLPSNYAPHALASPKFPYLSVTHVECSITVEAPKGNFIRTLVPTFFSSKSVCGNQNEGVTLYDGASANSVILGKVCDGSSNKLPLINSTTNVMHIRFKARDTPIAFKAVYEFAAQPQPVDPCTGHHCQNAGNCIASNDQYTCACVPGFSGRFCEANIDDCSGVPCFFNAKCIDKINDYECACPHGFTGKNCEYFIGACADDPCVHGQCNVTGRNDYTCHCDSGYVGKNCNVSDFCANSPCKYGSCVNTPSGYTCHCEPNYSGTNCDDVIFDVCSLRPCARGKCSSINMQFTCTCETGFTGRLCNAVIDHCNGVNCNHGNCVNDQTGYRCICDANFIGNFCETRKDLCSGIKCHHGNCIEETGGPQCSCNSGYTGAFCNSTIDHCLQNPCIHGTCRNLPNGFLCSCSPGFTGSLCSVNQDFCQNTDCGYGICENTEKGYHCICAKGYYGQRCNETSSSAGDLCKNHRCQNGGICRSNIQNYTCECSAGFVGQYCETQTGTKHTACADHPCSIGTCQELPNGISNENNIEMDAETVDKSQQSGGTDGGFEIKAGQVQVPKTKESSFSFRKLWAYTGPGFLMSIAYLDPGNIESDLQTGAIAKYKLLWVLMWSTVLGLILQLLAARLGCVTGMNLAEVCRHEYPKAPRLALWLMMEIAIIGSDIQEVIGSAIAINLLSNHKVPIYAGVLITGADTFTFLFLENYGLRKLEAFFGALITTMGFTFMYIYITIKPNQGDILIGMWFPWCEDCDKDAIQQLVGIVGAVIMPHNIYLHSALVLSRSIDRTSKKEISESIMYNGIESAIALFISFIINLFVVAVFAEAFSSPDDASKASLKIAGEWLGEKSTALKIIWGVGILAAGQSSTMTGTYAGQFVMEGFINIKWAKWKRVLLTRSIAMIPTITVALIATNDLDAMNNWLNVLQSVQLPFALLPVLHFTSSGRIMQSFSNGRMMKLLMWTLAVLVMGINFFLVIVFVGTGQRWYVYLLTTLVILVYSIYVLYVAIGPSRILKLKRYIYTWMNWSVDEITQEEIRRLQLNYIKFPVNRKELEGEISVQAEISEPSP